MLLFRLSLKRTWRLLAGTGFLMAGIQVLRVRIAALLHSSGLFDQITALLPAPIQKFLGSAMGSLMTFNGIVCGVYFDLAFMIALVALAIALATQPASEMETGFADLILARPMARHWLITRTIALVLFSVVLMLLMITGGTWAGLLLFAPPGVCWPSARLTTALCLNLGMLVLCWSGVAMAFGAAYRRGVAASITSLIAFAAMILDWATRLWPPLAVIDWVSPFYYFQSDGLVAGDPLYPENLLVLWAITCTGYIVAYFVLSQRDISR